jgi:hypothetical protein
LQLRKSPTTGVREFVTRFGPGHDSAGIGALLFILVFGGGLSFVALSKTGSSLNQMFEVFVAASVLSFVMAFRLMEELQPAQARTIGVGTGLLLLSMCLYPAAQISMNRMGPIVRATAADQRQYETLTNFLSAVKKPLFIRDDIYSLPWYSTGNRYPAITMDAVFYYDAKRRGFFKGNGIEDLVRSHWFAALFIQPTDEFYDIALAAGYQVAPPNNQWPELKNAPGKNAENRRLLLAPPF